ncbi:MAG: ArsB/NhaD family transporter [Deltaproteobacteria bacterium]|nr:ArsB/NhaD family transporter [Deltaproteobacteria bacterium]
MLKKLFLSVIFVFIFSFSAQADVINVSGVVRNTHGEPVCGVGVKLFHDNNKIAETYSGDNGAYNLTATLGEEPRSLCIQFYKSNYKRVTENISTRSYNTQKQIYFFHISPMLDRTITPAFYISLFVLVIVFGLISFELIHRTLAASLGAALVLFISYTLGTLNEDYFIISFEEAAKSVDLNVILLLMGMMIIVGVMKKTGVFQWLAYKSFSISKGNIFLLSAIFMFITAILSAFLDNVTTMLLITPVSMEIARVLGVSPFSLLIPMVLASNIGGTATLIGDPPNILIGSYAHLTFNDFLINLFPVVLIVLVVDVFLVKLYYGKEYKEAKIKDIDELLTKLRKECSITDRKLLKYCLFVLIFVIFMFIVHGFLNMEPCIAALAGAAMILIISGVDIVEVIEREIEWPTLVFFVMLFIVVGATISTGVIQLVASWIRDLSGGNLIAAMMLIMWVSAAASAVIDNIPFTATMLPVVAYLTSTIPSSRPDILWWALSLGACFGGNGTLIGASANVVTAGLLERSGFPLRFADFFKVGGPVTVVNLIISTLWLIIGG